MFALNYTNGMPFDDLVMLPLLSNVQPHADLVESTGNGNPSRSDCFSYDLSQLSIFCIFLLLLDRLISISTSHVSTEQFVGREPLCLDLRYILTQPLAPL